MRILCDHNVAEKYPRTFEREEWLTVGRVAEELSPTASDSSISAYATAKDWVLFTTDDDFYAVDRSHGLIVYSQIEDPRPGDVVQAIAAVDDAYASRAEITEVVPDGWI